VYFELLLVINFILSLPIHIGKCEDFCRILFYEATLKQERNTLTIFLNRRPIVLRHLVSSSPLEKASTLSDTLHFLYMET
jgi:hypothetical protein